MELEQHKTTGCDAQNQQDQCSSRKDYRRSPGYHAYTLYLFSCNNLHDIVVLGFLFGVLGAVASPVLGFGPNINLREILRRAPAMVFWSWTNLLLFNLHNQRHPNAVLEDSVNKPWRPLPAKRLTPTEATYWMYVMYPVVLVSSAGLGGLGPCLIEAFSCLWYNEWGGAESPVLKNFLNAAGFVCFLAGPLEISVGGVSLVQYPKAFQWLTIIGLAIFMTVHIQDFRDQDGDRQRDRRTVPLAIGDAPARWIAATSVLFWSCLASMFWQVGIAGLLLPLGIGVVLSFHLLARRTVESDALTWKIWPFWMTSFFFLPLMKALSRSGPS